MTSAELQAWLKANFPKENERHEWKGWRSLKHHVSGRAEDDVITYVSALANMEGGVLIVGVEDQTLAVIGIEDFHDYTPEKLKFRLVELCVNLPSEGLKVEERIASDSGAHVWLIHVPKHTARNPILAHGKAWQRVGDSLVELRPERREAILREPLAGEDWSAQLVPAASLSDLDPMALREARKNFSDRNVRKSWHAEIATWSDTEFLDRARLSINGQLTRAALLLLGKLQSTHLLSPCVAEITWKLPEESAVEHFGPPFILTATEVLNRVRNFNIKLYPETRLLAEEMPKYETKVILEALYNCVAHQDYERCERIVVEEWRSHLIFQNAGEFFDGQPELYLQPQVRTPSRYRNKCLAQAMVELEMIDTAGHGVRDMFVLQRNRFLPLPDYDFSQPHQVRLRVFGQVIDKNYTQLLMDRSDLPLEHVLWLDRVQKKLPVAAVHIAQLRSAKLIEGRKPNFFVSIRVAQSTGAETEYVLNKGFGDEECKDWIIKRLNVSPATGAELAKLIWGKLPAVLSEKEKETKIKNLRTALRLRGHKGVQIEVDPSGPSRGPKAVWRIRQK
jgi:ATP-dependent DNA helicase RecG